mmetsp:Transcript_33790/g.56741  ORF Transcript_33790/g.56741 Transcript_33790/m.56741 type:complete len:85 (+) Transcript_33790:713-967(+)
MVVVVWYMTMVEDHQAQALALVALDITCSNTTSKCLYKELHPLPISHSQSWWGPAAIYIQWSSILFQQNHQRSVRFVTIIFRWE